MKRLGAVAVVVALSGCFSAYQSPEGTSPEDFQRRMDQLLAERAAADAAAAEAHTKAIEDYIAGPGAGRPDRIKQALRDGRVVHGMTHAEVTVMIGGAGTRNVASTAEAVKSEWAGVGAKGPLIARERSNGHAGPLTVVFSDGVVTEVKSDEAK